MTQRPRPHPTAILPLLLCLAAGCAVRVSGLTPVGASGSEIKVKREMTREQAHEALKQSGYPAWNARTNKDGGVVGDTTPGYGYELVLYLFAYHGPHSFGVHREYSEGYVVVWYDASGRVTDCAFEVDPWRAVSESTLPPLPQSR